MAHMHVNSAALNIRATPDMQSDNILVALPFGYPVLTTGEASPHPWVSIVTIWNGKTFSGFVNVGYLRESLSDAKESLLAVAAMAWTIKDKNYALPNLDSGFERQSLALAKLDIGDVICTGHNDLVVAKGMTQVWALSGDLKLTRYPLLEDGHLDDRSGNVVAVMRNLV